MQINTGYLSLQTPCKIYVLLNTAQRCIKMLLFRYIPFYYALAGRTFQIVVTTFKKGLQFINVAMKPIKESGKLSLTECKKILNKNGNHYTDEEILAIRDWLYFVGDLTLTTLEDKKGK